MLAPLTWSRRVAAAVLVGALCVGGIPIASAQTLPVTTSVSGETATIVVGSPSNPVADLTLTFDDATGLSAASLGVRRNW